LGKSVCYQLIPGEQIHFTSATNQEGKVALRMSQTTYSGLVNAARSPSGSNHTGSGSGSTQTPGSSSTASGQWTNDGHANLNADLTLRQLQHEVFTAELNYSGNPQPVWGGTERGGQSDDIVKQAITKHLASQIPDSGLAEDMILQMVKSCQLPELGAKPWFSKYLLVDGKWIEVEAREMIADPYIWSLDNKGRLGYDFRK
jgi:hypothetical protein